jgi:hypothetical protein
LDNNIDPLRNYGGIRFISGIVSRASPGGYASAAGDLWHYHGIARTSEKVVREKGVSEEAILAVARLAAVIHGLAVVLDTERVAGTQPVTA